MRFALLQLSQLQIDISKLHPIVCGLLITVSDLQQQVFGLAVAFTFRKQAGQFKFGGDIVWIQGDRCLEPGYLTAAAERLGDAGENTDVPPVQEIQNGEQYDQGKKRIAHQAVQQ
ncbi:hypothetical protein D3C73_1228550 [compost metagenome]